MSVEKYVNASITWCINSSSSILKKIIIKYFIYINT